MGTETSPRAIMSRPVLVPGATATSLDEIEQVLRERHPDPAQAPRHLTLARATRVATRYLSRPIQDLLDPEGGTRAGLGWVSDTLFELTGRAARQALDQQQVRPGQVDTLVVASVSGWMMPGIAEYLGNALGLRPGVRRIACTQSGCAGSAVALQRAAEQVALHPDAVVLVVVADIGSAAIQPCLADELARHFDDPPGVGDAGLIIGLGPGVQCEALTCWWEG